MREQLQSAVDTAKSKLDALASEWKVNDANVSGDNLATRGARRATALKHEQAFIEWRAAVKALAKWDFDETCNGPFASALIELDQSFANTDAVFNGSDAATHAQAQAMEGALSGDANAQALIVWALDQHAVRMRARLAVIEGQSVEALEWIEKPGGL